MLKLNFIITLSRWEFLSQQAYVSQTMTCNDPFPQDATTSTELLRENHIEAVQWSARIAGEVSIDTLYDLSRCWS